MKIFCYFALHSWIEHKQSAYWDKYGKHVIIKHTLECCVCGKKIEYV